MSRELPNRLPEGVSPEDPEKASGNPTARKKLALNKKTLRDLTGRSGWAKGGAVVRGSNCCSDAPCTGSFIIQGC